MMAVSCGNAAGGEQKYAVRLIEFDREMQASGEKKE
jgi:hypothetical protein